jgi:uridine kinase
LAPDADPGTVDGIVPAITAAITAAAGVRRPIILIDGGSGSGKTELAAILAPALGAELVRLDDIYPGWDGLEAASRMIPGIIGEHRWRRWDWAADEPAEWHGLDPERTLIIEGCGSLSRANRALATFGIWVELDEPTRKTRALARDGDAYAPHWDRWAAQERAFFERERPDRQADDILAG